MATHFPAVPIEEVPTTEIHDSAELPLPMVLLVDNDPVITYTLQAILKKSGLAVLTARDAADALEIAALVPPDILVTDLNTPEMNGINLALDMHSIVPDCKVILSAGIVFSSEDAPENLVTGADFAVLSKPVHPSTLLDCIFERLAAKGLKCSRADLHQDGD